MRDVVVIGGGIAGLAAAWDLRNRDVVVLEGTERLGGRIRSEPRGPYWLNLGAHVFSGPGSATGPARRPTSAWSRCRCPGTSSRSSSTASLLVGGRPELYPLRLPLRRAERVALARAGARLRVAVARYERVAKPRPGESPADTRRRLLAHGDDQTFAEWLGELPGRRRPDVPGHRDALDGRARGDHRGRGHRLLRARVELRAGASRATSSAARARSSTASQPSWPGASSTTPRCSRSSPRASSCACATARPAPSASCCARHAIVATKAFDAARLIRDLPAETSSALNAIPYGPTVVMAMLTNETAADAVGRPLRARDARSARSTCSSTPSTSCARAARCARPAAASWSTAPATPR